jgi:hypothetical protein
MRIMIMITLYKRLIRSVPPRLDRLEAHFFGFLLLRPAYKVHYSATIPSQMNSTV